MLPRCGWRQDGMSPARSHRRIVLPSVPRSREIWRKETPVDCRRTASSKRARRPACAAGPRGVVAASGPSIVGGPAAGAPPPDILLNQLAHKHLDSDEEEDEA